MNPPLPQLDPQTLQILTQELGIRYTETEPTHTPNKPVEAWVYFDATDYWFYLWANGGWRKVELINA